MIIVSSFDIRIVRLTPLKNEAVAVLHAMRLERIVYLFIRVVEKVRRDRNSFRNYVYETGNYQIHDYNILCRGG